MANLFYLPYRPAYDSAGQVVPGAQVLFTNVAGTKKPIYSNSGLTTQRTNPVVADGAGKLPTGIYLDPAVTYRVRIYSKTAVAGTDTPIQDFNPYVPGVFADATALQPVADAAEDSAVAAQAAAAIAIAAAADVDPSLYSLITPQIYGAVADGSTDCTAAIQAALDAINGLGGGTLYFPEGTYKVSSYLTVYKKTNIRGAGRKASIITTAAVGGSGGSTDLDLRNGSVFYSNWTSNTSTAVDISVDDIGITCSNALNVGAAFYDNGGSFINLRRVTVTGFKYGVVFDQTELSDLELCDFEGQATGGLWLVNGADLKAGNSGSFTNRISTSRCQFNQLGTAYGIIDDGGYSHSYVDNNYNGCLNHIRAAGVTGLRIAGGEFESAASHNVRFEFTSLAAASVGQCSAVNVGGGAVIAPTNGFSPFFAVSLGDITLNGVFLGNTSAVKFAGTTNTNAIYALDLPNGGGGATFDGRATNHFEVGNDGTTFKIRTNMPIEAYSNIASLGGSIGYGAGAGGVVTQATNKSTGVILNTLSGQITMNGAALASAAKVSFVVTDSQVAATDTVIASVASGGTANAYRAAVTAVAAGSFTITVENITAGSLSQAPVINFAVIKGASA